MGKCATVADVTCLILTVAVPLFHWGTERRKRLKEGKKMREGGRESRLIWVNSSHFRESWGVKWSETLGERERCDWKGAKIVPASCEQGEKVQTDCVRHEKSSGCQDRSLGRRGTARRKHMCSRCRCPDFRSADWQQCQKMIDKNAPGSLDCPQLHTYVDRRGKKVWITEVFWLNVGLKYVAFQSVSRSLYSLQQ